MPLNTPLLRALLPLFFVILVILSSQSASADNHQSDPCLFAEMAGGSGFWCEEKCPAPPVGSSSTYVSLNCTCAKDKVAGTCTPSGKCDEYVSGQKTGSQVDCICEKHVTKKKKDADIVEPEAEISLGS